MKTNQSILQTIYNDIIAIEWSSNTVQIKALDFATKIFDIFIYKYKSFDQYMPMSKEYWSKLITGKTDHLREIKSKLISNNILNEINGLYNKDKRVKSFKFNNKYINLNNINNNNIQSFIIIADPFSKQLEINDLEYIENTTKTLIERLNVIKGVRMGSIVDEQINKGVREGSVSLEYIDLILEGKKYRYKTENAIKLSNELNKKLISYKKNYYLVDDVEAFKEYKRNELTIIYNKQIFDIENNIIHVSRNETNNRLDSNLTNLKSDLWEYLRLDDEKLLEIDIINSQFAIAANIINCDDNFKEFAITGYLYDYIAEKLNITRNEAKSLMMKVAFDKVKEEQDIIRNLFPIFMNSVDTYKKENGYKSFSNLLQCKESSIMIDNVLIELLKMGYEVFSVHDSIRCKESDYNNVLKTITEIFNRIDFKCTLKNKVILNDSNELKTENNDIILETENNSLEAEKTTLKADKKMYEDYIKEKLYATYTHRLFKINKDKILNHLVKQQPNNKKEIKIKIKEII